MPPRVKANSQASQVEGEEHAVDASINPLDLDIHTHAALLQESYGTESETVWQVVSMRDISAPSTSVSSKPLVHATLTNGSITVSAVLLDHIETFNINTLPGTKILVKRIVCEEPIKSSGGTFLVSSKQCCLLGGHVKSIALEWEKEKISRDRYLEDRLTGGRLVSTNKPPRFTPYDPSKEAYTPSSPMVVPTPAVPAADPVMTSSTDPPSSGAAKSSKVKKESDKSDEKKVKKTKKHIHKDMTGTVSQPPTRKQNKKEQK